MILIYLFLNGYSSLEGFAVVCPVCDKINNDIASIDLIEDNPGTTTLIYNTLYTLKKAIFCSS